MNSRDFSKLTFFSLLALAAILPVTLLTIYQQQSIRSQAAGFYNSNQAVSSGSLIARVSPSTLTQDKAYTLYVNNTDGTPYSGYLDVSMLQVNGSYSTPSLWTDANRIPISIVNGSTVIDLLKWRNPTTGKFMNLGSYTAKFKPQNSADSNFSNPITVNIVPYDLTNYMPFWPPGSYISYKKIPGTLPSNTIFRFDIEKNITSLCDGSILPVFRMSQTNLGQTGSRFMSGYTFRFALKWTNGNLQGAGIMFYSAPDNQKNDVLPLGDTGDFRRFTRYSPTGWNNLPSFYMLPGSLNLDFYADGPFQASADNSCSGFSIPYYWAVDYRILTAEDLNLGIGPGALKAGDLQVRFFEHQFPAGKPNNREDWFFRQGFGVVQIEKSIVFSEACIAGQHTNYSCWNDPNLAKDAVCNCWSRRINKDNLSDGFMLDYSKPNFYTPTKLDVTIKESGSKSYTVKRGRYYTIKITNGYSGYLAEIGKPDIIWKTYTCNEPYGISGCTGNLVTQNVWVENGELKIYIPPTLNPGVYKGQFRSWIWGQPVNDPYVFGKSISPTFPAWSDPIYVTVQ
jgi:hypothetical protein